MKIPYAKVVLLVLAVAPLALAAEQGAPLKLVEKFQLAVEVKGRFDHLGVDLKNNRLFATPEDYHALLVWYPAFRPKVEADLKKVA